MDANNPAGQPCNDKDAGPVHNWIRRADGTAYCTKCGVQLDAAQTADAFPPPPPEPSQVSRRAGSATKA